MYKLEVQHQYRDHCNVFCEFYPKKIANIEDPFSLSFSRSSALSTDVVSSPWDAVHFRLGGLDVRMVITSSLFPLLVSLALDL